MAKTQPQELEFADAGPYQVDASHDCPAPASAVFEVLKDNRGGARWLGWFVTSVEPTSDPEHGVGATRAVTFLYGLGRLEERFIAWQEPSLWSFTATSFRPGVFSKFVERVRIEPADDGSCRIVYRAAFDFTPLARPLARIVAGWLNRE
jgi:hypothetical protein